MAHKITRNITKVKDIDKLGMNVTNECDLVSDGKNVYVRVGKEYRQIDNEKFIKTINGKKPNDDGNVTIWASSMGINNNNPKNLLTLFNEIEERLTALEKTNESE